MEKERKEEIRRIGPPPESIILAFLYKWTLVGRPDPIADLGLYGFSRSDFLCIVAGLVEKKMVMSERQIAIGGSDNLDRYKRVPIENIITNPEAFREAYAVTRDIGKSRLDADVERYNMIFGIVNQINEHIRR